MQSFDTPAELRQRLASHLLRAYQALSDERLSAQDALAITRNVTTTVTFEVDTVAGSPAIAS
jgi:hypothetical protein